MGGGVGIIEERINGVGFGSPTRALGLDTDLCLYSAVPRKVGSLRSYCQLNSRQNER